MRKQKFFTVGLYLIGAIVILSSILMIPEKASAHAWYENLISDSEFTNKYSMTNVQIQNFLAAKGSGLANYTVPSSVEGVAQYGAGRRASRYIYDAARAYGINPKVILVTLQKEESLITTTTPSSIRLKYAMGYAIYSGSSCLNPASPDYKYCFGFGNQIHFAAARMKSWFNSGSGPSGCSVGQYCQITTRSWESGKTNVYLSNRATALLYRYTPYIYNGNYNFYRLYHSWFGPGSSNWSFLLIRAVGDPKVYLVDRSQKIYIPTIEIFNHWGFSASQIVNLSADKVDDYTLRPQNLTRLVRGSTSAKVYFIESSRKKYIPTAQMLNLLGLSLTTLDQNLVNGIRSGVEYAPFIQAANGFHWLVSGRTKYYVSAAMMVSWGLEDSAAYQVSNDSLTTLVTGSQVGQLIRGAGFRSIWRVENGQKKWVPDPATLYALYHGQGVRILPIPIVAKQPGRGANKWALVKGSDLRVYWTGNGTKRWIPSLYTLQLWGFKASQIKRVPQYMMSAVRTGSPKFYLAKGSGATVYWLYSGVKRAIPDPGTFFAWSFSSADIHRVSNNWLASKRTARGLRRLVKSASSDQIYYLEWGRKRWIPSIQIFNQYGFSWSDIVTVNRDLVNYYRSGPDM